MTLHDSLSLIRDSVDRLAAEVERGHDPAEVVLTLRELSSALAQMEEREAVVADLERLRAEAQRCVDEPWLMRAPCTGEELLALLDRLARAEAVCAAANELTSYEWTNVLRHEFSNEVLHDAEQLSSALTAWRAAKGGGR